MAEITLQHLRKTYGKVVAIKDLSLDIKDGEFLDMLGRGRVIIGGHDVTALPPGKRGIAMVFQSYAVFPHMRVYDNIVFGLRMRGVSPGEQRKRAEEGAELLQIASLFDRYPAQLSGGQRQRVAVARAIVMRPDVLLMDEPLSNLDALLRLPMRAELKRIHREGRSTTGYVTHDQVEGLSLGDHIAVMLEGALGQCDTPARIYNAPANRFVGSFIGSPPMNFLSGTLRTVDGRLTIERDGARIPLPPARKVTAAPVDGTVLVGIRPEHIEGPPAPAAGGVPGAGAGA